MNKTTKIRIANPMYTPHVKFDQTSEHFIAEAPVLDESHGDFESVRQHRLLIVRLENGFLEDVETASLQGDTQGLKVSESE